jgi:hypothetical protein
MVKRIDPLGINLFVTQDHDELREFVERLIGRFRADQPIST